MSSHVKLNQYLDPLINKYIISDGKKGDLRQEIQDVVNEQQAQLASSPHEFSKLMTQFYQCGLDLINSNDPTNPSRFKLAGVIVLDSLLDVNDDVKLERKFEIANYLCKVLENDRPPLATNEIVLRQAASTVGHYVRNANRSEIDHFGNLAFTTASKLMMEARSESRRFAGALIISVLATNAPVFIFNRRQELFTVLWSLVCDKNPKVRVSAGEALESSLQTMSQGTSMSEYVQHALFHIDSGFASNSSAEKSIGSMIILDILVNGVVSASDIYNEIIASNLDDDLIWKILQRKDSKDEEVRKKVIEVLPNIADAFAATFVKTNRFTNTDNFLLFSLKFFMSSIMAKKQRSIVYLSLGKLCMKMANQLRNSSIVDDMLPVICEGFKDPFCVEALQCLGMIVSSSLSIRRLVDDQLVHSMFRGGLTQVLVETLKVLSKYIPAIRGAAKKQLLTHISRILKKYNVLIDEVRGKSNSQLRLSKSALAALQTQKTIDNKSSSHAPKRWPNFSLSNVSKPESVVYSPASTSGVLKPEDELLFVLKLLTLPEFFPKMVRERSGTSVPTDKADDFLSIELLGLVRYSVVKYLDDYDTDVRIAAAKACAAVLDSTVQVTDFNKIEFQYILQILDRLLILGVGDDSVEIRVLVFSSLSPSLDQVITLTENMHCLIEALNDENLHVRIAATTMFSRCGHYDTLHIMPVMRLTMKRLILTLTSSRDYTIKKESVQMLQALVNGSHSLIVPYVHQLIQPLMSLLKSSSVNVAVAALSTIGDLAVASPDSVRVHLSELSPRLIEALNDQRSLSKQETAVIAMGKLVSSLTIDVAGEPYKKFDGLFEGLVRAIQSKDESSSELRLQAIKTVGLLGIVDINAYKRYLEHLESSKITDQSEYQTDNLEVEDNSDDDESVSDVDDDLSQFKRIEKSYFGVVMKKLMDILRDSALTQYHAQAVSAAVRVLRIVGPQAAQAAAVLKELFDGFLYRIRHPDCSYSTRDQLLDNLIWIIYSVGGHALRDHLETIIDIVCDYADVHLKLCLDIVDALSKTIATPHFYLVLKSSLSVIFQQVREEINPRDNLTELQEEDIMRDRQPMRSSSIGITSSTSFQLERSRAGIIQQPRPDFVKTKRTLRLINNIADSLGESRRDIISFFLKVLDNSHLLTEIRRDSLATIMKLATDVDLLEFASKIIHPLLRLAPKADLLMQSAIVTALSCILCRIGRGYLPYIVPVRRCLRFISIRENSSKVNRIEEYESLVNRLLKQRPLPPEPSDMSDILISMEKTRPRASISKTQLGIESPPSIDLPSLETAWTFVGRRTNSSDVNDWMNRLSMELIRQSPSPIIRACTTLATVYRPLAQSLFYCSFHCLWEHLFASDFEEIVEDNPLVVGIETALQSSHSSKKAIIIPLLNLAEYMEMQDKRLPLDIRLLADQARNANMFAKCLYNREIEFRGKNFAPSADCIDSLISVNNQLGLSDNAAGLLQIVKLNYPHIPIQSSWLEKLDRWEDAQRSYEDESTQICSQLMDAYELRQEREAVLSDTFDLSPIDNSNKLSSSPLSSSQKMVLANSEGWMTRQIGKLRCLHALGEFEQLQESARSLRDQIKSTENVDKDEFNAWSCMTEVQRLGANASWMLGEWISMDDFLEGSSESSEQMDVVLDQNISFYQAIMAIHNKDYDKADALISDTRSKLAGSIGSLLSEKYSRAYRAMVTMQVLAEMEEIVDYKRFEQKAMTDLEAIKNNNTNVDLPDVILSDDLTFRSSTRKKSNDSSLNNNVPGIVDINAKRYNLILKWRGRLEWAPKRVDVYRQILAVHTLVTEPTEDLDSWLELVTLCRKERMHSLCENILRKIGAPLPQRKGSSETMLTDLRTPSSDVINSVAAPAGVTNDRVMLSTFEYLWSKGEKPRALHELSEYLKVKNVSELSLSSSTRRYSAHESTLFRVECLLKRADWMRELNEGEGAVRDTFPILMEARELAGERYSVWHAWAVANYDYLKKADSCKDVKDSKEPSQARMSLPLKPGMNPARMKNNRTAKLSSSSGSASLLNILSSQQADSVTQYITEAIRGFVKSIMLGEGQPVANVLQDILRLITLWFSYGTKKGVNQILEAELQRISPDNWLAVLPQLIARIHIKSTDINSMLRKLLIKLATAHPQALVGPISVAFNTNDSQQQKVAGDVLHEMRKSRSQLVEEATMVSRELMRVAITPHELWYDGLEQAAQLYIDNKDISSMLLVLTELHEAMNDNSSSSSSSSIVENKPMEGFAEGIGKIGHITLRDISFRHCYSKPLNDAYQWLEQFKRTNRVVDLHQAWDIYHQLFKKIKIQINSLKKLELHHVSPALTNANDLSLIIPGTYKPGCTDITIKSFLNHIGVIASKQRPRRISFLGSNGERFEFLLKGHEDLRQDERVMQLFGLINACLNNDSATNNRGLEIVRYSVMPLSNNSGVIGWVQNCDTINQLIKQYREAKDIRLILELKLLQSKCFENYDNLPLMHKVELFHQVLYETTGRDLTKMLWLKSKTSDVWVERRANFTKSMAVMSMVGYILGLGDRHPSNLMLDRIGGKVVHIDFGDCFEITKNRSKYPEIIPFRLTRMLTNCMGPSGIQGSYRLTCQRVMSVLRDNRDSVMAMLEAFVYDPLISWRLLANKEAPVDKITAEDQGNTSVMDKVSEEIVGNSVIDVDDEDSPMKNSSTVGDSNPAKSLMVSNQNQSMRDLKRMMIVRTSSTDIKEEGAEPLQENLNTRALEVINRIQAKLTGRDFVKNDDSDDLTIEEQVERLIMEATSVENLCQLFSGWCPLW